MDGFCSGETQADAIPPPASGRLTLSQFGRGVRQIKSADSQNVRGSLGRIAQEAGAVSARGLAGVQKLDRHDQFGIGVA